MPLNLVFYDIETLAEEIKDILAKRIKQDAARKEFLLKAVLVCADYELHFINAEKKRVDLHF